MKFILCLYSVLLFAGFHISAVAQTFRMERAAIRIITLMALFSTLSTVQLFGQWQEIVLPRPQYLYDDIRKSWKPLGPMEWADSLQGYVFEQNGLFYKTKDGGVSWEKDSLVLDSVSIGLRNLGVYRCDFATPEFGVVTMSIGDASIHSDSAYAVTTDGGKTWQGRTIRVKGKTPVTGTKMYPTSSGTLIFCCGVSNYSGNDSVGYVYEEIMMESTNTGAEWQVLTSDTLNFLKEDRAFTWEWLRVDSVTTYRFTFSEELDFYDGYVKVTTDAGRSWEVMKAPVWTGHPFLQVGRHKLLSIKRVNDTGLVVCTGFSKDGRVGTAMVARDVRYHYDTNGWWKIPQSSERWSDIVVDACYMSGHLYYLTSTYGTYDSLHVVDIVNSCDRASYETPVKMEYHKPELSLLYTPSPGRLYLWTRWGVWRHYVTSTGMGHRVDTGWGENVKIYPNPVSLSANKRVYVKMEESSGTVEVVEMIDMQGRVVDKWIAGASSEFLNIRLSDLMGGASKYGVYFLKVISMGEVSIGKIMIVP